MVGDCIFCKIANKKIRKEFIYENDNFVSFLDASPITKGHSLVISKKHFKTSLDIPSSLGNDLLDCIKRTAVKILKDENSEGFNIVNNNFGSAGQVVDHVHYHIVPRKKGDGLKVVG